MPVSNDVVLIKTAAELQLPDQLKHLLLFSGGSDYYEAVFSSASAGTIHFQALEMKPKVTYPNFWFNLPSKILFLFSLAGALLLTLKITLSSHAPSSRETPALPAISRKARRRLLALLVFGLAVWLIVLAVNSNSLAAMENWYTDNARDSYTASLFLKDGFSIFSQPLGKLADLDSSRFMFVTWPQMPHLYPLGSILLFMPFGALIQAGFEPDADVQTRSRPLHLRRHSQRVLFPQSLLKKDMTLILKLLGVYIIYVTLVAYAADGMFDSVAFIFSIFAIYMFLTERYDYFFLLVAASVFFKYEAGIFLLPLIVVGLGAVAPEKPA